MAIQADFRSPLFSAVSLRSDRSYISRVDVNGRGLKTLLTTTPQIRMYMCTGNVCATYLSMNICSETRVKEHICRQQNSNAM